MQPGFYRTLRYAQENAEIANRMALRTLRKVQRKVGFAERLK